jgi:hypothetical protein
MTSQPVVSAASVAKRAFSKKKHVSAGKTDEFYLNL